MSWSRRRTNLERMVVVIELVERQPPIGTLSRENLPGVRFEGWLGLIGALTKLFNEEDQRLARAAAEMADRGARPVDEETNKEETSNDHNS